MGANLSSEQIKNMTLDEMVKFCYSKNRSFYSKPNEIDTYLQDAEIERHLGLSVMITEELEEKKLLELEKQRLDIVRIRTPSMVRQQQQQFLQQHPQYMQQWYIRQQQQQQPQYMQQQQQQQPQFLPQQQQQQQQHRKFLPQQQQPPICVINGVTYYYR